MRLISRAGYFVFIKINMKTPKKKSEYPSGPRSYFSNSPKVSINKVNKNACKGTSKSWKK